MQRRVRNLPLAERLPERFRRRLGPTGGSPTAPLRRRRISRREREARRHRQLRWGMIIAGALVLLVLGVGAANEYVLKPRHVVAAVDGTEIRRRDYWKVRVVDLFQQASQFSQFAQFSQGDQVQQYQQAAANARAQVDDVWGSTDVDATTLNRMVEDQLYVQNLDELDLSVTDQDIDDYIARQFEPANAPIFTPTPTPTYVPARAAAATQTAQAAESATAAATASARAAAPVPTSATLPGPPGLGATATAAAGTDSGGTPAAGVGTPEGSPVAGSPTVSPTQEGTPNPEEARATAAAGFEEYRDVVFDEARISRGEYERWVVRPAVARQKIQDALNSQVPQTAEQVHAAHILVDTQDLANQTYQELQAPGASFEQAARDRSTDESTAGNGGDLGWFARGAMVDQFEAVAFAQPPGTISEPFETEFGWHIVKVYEYAQDRALTDEQIRSLQQDRVADWLAQQREEADVSAEIEPTPTPAAQQFEPPPDAPPPPTATPTPTPAASPIASPVASPAAGGPPPATPSG